MAAAAANDSPWRVETLHDAIPGRTRFRIRGLRANTELARRCAGQLRSLDGIRGVDASASTGTLLVRHDVAESAARLQLRVSTALSEIVGRTVATARQPAIRCGLAPAWRPGAAAAQATDRQQLARYERGRSA